MNKQIEKMSQLLPKEKKEDVLAKKKAENARKIRERTLQANPELQARREESATLLARAQKKAMEEFGIDPEDLGEEARKRNNRTLQDRAAQERGYASGGAMIERGVTERETMIGRARAWFENTWGITWINKKDTENKKNAA
jgi:hypothetical protein